MLKKLSFIIILFLAALQCGKSAPTAIPMGSWNYRLLMNGVAIGKATISNELKNGIYTSGMEMTMEMGRIKNTARQVTVETDSFQPIKLEILNTVVNGSDVQKMHTTALFSGKNVTVNTDGMESTVTIEKPFILDGNFFMSQLLKEKFKPGARVSAYLYDPTFELEEPVRVIARVMGSENISIDGKTISVIHIVQAIENFKNIDIYIDESGVTQKAVIVMLNNKIELLKEQ
ncbi:MAG: hypothetical protein CVV44_19535 [Spirochaetae bacterium HGW-Spirochaetae-1]|jgi:hypothetical protein|nr:MAG: hypothetical protein CVV44_19535 [Spirochaetae bacterium HGW-Spirochaetae-1]